MEETITAKQTTAAPTEKQVLTPGGFRAASQVHSFDETAAATPAPQTTVLTPGGYRPLSEVHHIEAGHELKLVDGNLKKFELAGAMVKDFGKEIALRGDTLQLASAKKMQSATNDALPADTSRGVVPAFGTGWIANTGWTNNSGHPITSFSTTWVVPPAPATQSGQTIFLFNGIQNSGWIYQPVLQWGSSAAGGGNFWTIASWYVSSTTAFHSTLIPVNPGTVLTGVMVQTGQSGNQFSYNCFFQGIANSGYPIANIEQLTWANETLEAYSITKASDYPATDCTSFTGISIITGGTTHPAVSWTEQNRVTDIGQHVRAISNSSTNGEVDIFYRGIFMAWKGVNNDQGIYYSTLGGNNWVPQAHINGVGTSVGPCAALFNGRVFLAWKGMNADQGIYYSSFNGSTWMAQKNVAGVGTSFRPALAVFNGRLYMVWKGINNDQGIYYSFFDGNNWAPQKIVGGVGTSVGPALAVFNGKLYMAWKGINNDQGIYYSSFDGANWAPQKNVAGVGTSVGPALAVFNGRLYMAWKGINNDQGIYHSSFDGANWAPQKNVPGVATSFGPALGVYGSALYMSWKGASADQGIYFSTFNGAAWAAQQNVGGVGTSICTCMAGL